MHRVGLTIGLAVKFLTAEPIQGFQAILSNWLNAMELAVDRQDDANPKFLSPYEHCSEYRRHTLLRHTVLTGSWLTWLHIQWLQ